jgi:ribonuclease P protein component
VLPEPHRLHHHSDFSRTVRRGHRIGRRDVVVHALIPDVAVVPPGVPDDAIVSRVGGPRVGLIVNKAVGSAVVRHRVSRRLRHVCAQLFAEMLSTANPHAVPLRAADLVIRALPSAASASSAELTGQLRSGFEAALSRRPSR